MMDNRRNLFPDNMIRKFIFIILTTVQWGIFSIELKGEDSTVGIEVPEGFQVSIFADNDMVPDIYSITTTSQGKIAVSGPGYIRILQDTNNDGKADSYIQFSDGPKTGAQGMYFNGNDLLCLADKGLIRYRDENGDQKADGPPDVFLQIKSGGEHHAHSIQKGPDGWWYLIAGNDTGISSQYITLPNSPIKNPKSGVLIRLKPDLSGGEVLCDGLRNAYDFAFGLQGDIFIFDSDGERDISLPWYRPTRVFQMSPGSSAGWLSRSWKRPGNYSDMPPVVGSFGRGSPTGSVCYLHNRFPKEYFGSLFVMDWTYGRVFALPLKENGSTWKAKPILFMKGKGAHGFAPTDIAVDPDGTLFVSVGGRGTRGVVYRVTYPEKYSLKKKSDNKELLKQCLNANQPLSSWSRNKWVPVAKKLGKASFINAAIDSKHAIPARIRALEIITELYKGITAEELRLFQQVNSPQVRAKAIWSYGGSSPASYSFESAVPFLNDRNPLVARFALESILRFTNHSGIEITFPSLTQQLSCKDHFVRQQAGRVVARLSKQQVNTLVKLTHPRGAQGLIALATGLHERSHHVDPVAASLATDVITGQFPESLKLEAIRLMQLILGGMGPGKDHPAVFDGYRATLNLEEYERILDPIRIRLSKYYPTSHEKIDHELGRLIAMLTVYSPDVLNKVLARMTKSSDPVQDVHHLIIAASIPVDRNANQTKIIAETLVQIDHKLKKRELKQDTNWDDRMGELYKELIKYDPYLPGSIILEEGFGLPAHVLYMSEIASEELPKAIDAFIKQTELDEDYEWTNDVVFVIGESKEPKHRELIKSLYEISRIQGAVQMVLAENPEESDRDKFIEGLNSSLKTVLTSCIGALNQLPETGNQKELTTLVKTMRRLGSDPSEYPIRESIVKLLRKKTGLHFDFVFGKTGYNSQSDVLKKWTDWAIEKDPEFAKELENKTGGNLKLFLRNLAQVEWDAGDSQKGKKLFEKKSCVQCHGGRKAIGPNLAGSSKRFSRKDLFVAIGFPNRDVSPRYQTSLIQTVDGKMYSGLIIYESIDGLLMRNSSNQTFRIESEDIDERKTLETSLMPAGLLDQLSDKELADLFAYIKTLK